MSRQLFRGDLEYLGQVRRRRCLRGRGPEEEGEGRAGEKRRFSFAFTVETFFFFYFSFMDVVFIALTLGTLCFL